MLNVKFIENDKSATLSLLFIYSYTIHLDMAIGNTA